MSSRSSASYRTGSWALLAAVAGIIFIVNYLSQKAFTRLDLTETRRYTLSDSTIKMLEGLDDVVSVRGVFSDNIPSPYNQQIREVKDLLREYSVYGGENLDLELINPAGRPELKSELQRMGIRPVQLPTRGTEQVSIIEIWASIYLQYRDNTEVLPYAFNTETLEYDLTSAVYRVTMKEKPEVGLLNLDEEREITKEFATLKRALEKQFKVTEATSGEELDQTLAVLMVLNPYRLNQRQLYNIDQYIMGGGNVIFLTDGVRVFLQPGQYGGPIPVYAMPLNERTDSLGGLLEHYGVRRNYDLVQDENFRAYPLLGPIGTEYPLFPVIDMSAENQIEHPISQGLDHLVFAWTSSLELLQQGDTAGDTEAVKLVKTSPNSWVQAGGQLQVNPMQEPVPPLPLPGMGEDERTLAVLLTGEFESFFAGRAAPAPESGDTVGVDDEDKLDKSQETSLLVVGCSYFVSEMTPLSAGDVTQNINFLISAVEWMTGGSKLSDIKKRRVENRPVRSISYAESILIGLVLPLAAPAAVVLFGVARFTVRKRKKKKFLESVKP